ncbi:MAG: A/G-specific adenine glycosylase [Candidatus Babeliales bacterium]
MTKLSIKQFRTIIWDHYNASKREFAWRTTSDPYHILVSEIMLQQTQTHRVAPKYDAFLKRFPNFSNLAQAPLADVLCMWQGLGYNRRAKSLHNACKEIVTKYNGIFPHEPEELIALPGIGPYTAHAVCTFAFNKPHVFIETNIRTVFIHFFFQKKDKISDKELMPFIKEALDSSNPREWYYALMDYGVLLKSHMINPSRKSKHHAVQSKFEGSDRQIRGAIIRLLTESVAISYETIIMNINKEEERVKKILYQLCKEEMIIKQSNIFRLPH